MRLQAANSTTTMYYSVTNAVPAKPYLPIASGANTYYLPLTTATLAGVKLKVQSGNATYRACTYQSGYYNTTSAAVGNLSSTTALTSASTSAYSYKSSASTSGYSYKTSASTSGYSYKTSASTVNYTVEAWTKPIVNNTSYRSLYLDYQTIGYFTNTEYSDAKVSGNIIVNHWESWQEAGNVITTSPTNFVDKFAFRLTARPYPKLYNYTTWYNGSQVPMLYAYFTISGNTARTSSSTQPLQSQPQQYSTVEIYLQSTYIINGVSTNSPFPWTSWFYTGQQASNTKNSTYITLSSNTNHRIYVFGNIFSTQTTSMTYTWWHAWSSYRLSNPFHSSYAMWVTATTTSHTHILYREYRSREAVNTSSTKPVTSSTVPLTKPVTYSTVPLTKPVTYSTIPLTKPVTYGYSGKLSSSKWA